jgi:hypothetical protein
MLASTLTVLDVRNPSKNDGFRFAPLYEISRNIELVINPALILWTSNRLP